MVSAMDPGSGGYAMLVASSGKIIVLPERGISDVIWSDAHRRALAETYRPVGEQRWTPDLIEVLETTSLDDSPDPAIRTLALETRAGLEGTRRALVADTQRLLTYAPIPRTGWTLAVVVPFDQVLVPARAIRGVIGDALRRAVWSFAGIVAGLLAFGLVLSRVFNAQLVRPVVRLTRAVEQISWENLDLPGYERDRPDEIGDLTRRFRHMLQLLREARNEDQRKARTIEVANEQVVKLEAVGTLAAGIAHDFNNLLTAIVGNVSLALYRLPRDASVRAWLESAEAAGMRARDLTQQLLTFSKGGDPILQVVTLAEVLADNATFVLRGSKSLCRVDIPSDLWPVEADAGQIGRVVQNLVLNADQAMPSGGTIHLVARNVSLNAGEQEPLTAGRYVEVSCTDNGAGIDAADLPRIFDAFYTTKPTGSGLGLSVCLSIVRKHGGFIRADSAVGRGTTVRFWLPASERAASAARAADGQVPTGRGRILVMDNEELVLELARNALGELGYEATLAPDGSQALAIYRERLTRGQPFDAAILDLTVPGDIGGLEVARRIRELDRGARLIVSSGYSADPVLAEPRAHGFDAAVNKPYRVTQLANVLSTVTRSAAA
jgi:signal transduction histidine kinase/ActR/RegA family two-component response regulator